MKKLCAVFLAFFIAAAAYAQSAGTVTNHAFAVGKGAGKGGYTSVLCAAGQVALGQSAADPLCVTVSGDGAISASGVLTLATVNANVGSFGSATQCVIVTFDAKGRATAASAVPCTPPVSNLTGMGANVPAALAIAVGSAGGPVVNGGVLGTPSSGNGANLTALNATQLTSGILPPARLNGLGVLTNSLGADVAMNVTANYFDGPSIAQGATGTWFASGQATVTDTAVGANFFCKLWDGTTVVDSADVTTSGASFNAVIHLSGALATPAGNLRISCRDPAATTGKMLFNGSGNSKDSTITAFRIN